MRDNLRLAVRRRMAALTRTSSYVADLIYSMVFLIAFFVGSALAQDARSVRVIMYANEHTKLKEFGISSTFSQTVVGTSIPTTYTHSLTTGRAPIKSTVLFFARWADDKRQAYRINLSALSDIDQVDIHFFRHNITELTASAFANEKCRHTSSGDPETLFSRLFACKDLVEWLESQSPGEWGTHRYYQALNGWFYASWHLFQLGGATIRAYDLDPEVKARMDQVLKYHAERGTSPVAINVADIKNKLKDYQVADVFLINDVNRLRTAGKIEEAKQINDYLIEKLPEFQKAVGSTLVYGVNMDLLKRNEAYLYTKAIDRGIDLK